MHNRVVDISKFMNYFLIVNEFRILNSHIIIDFVIFSIFTFKFIYSSISDLILIIYFKIIPSNITIYNYYFISFIILTY